MIGGGFLFLREEKISILFQESTQGTSPAKPPQTETISWETQISFSLITLAVILLFLLVNFILILFNYLIIIYFLIEFQRHSLQCCSQC